MTRPSRRPHPGMVVTAAFAAVLFSGAWVSAAPSAADAGCPANAIGRTVPVRTAGELHAALAQARPGDRISLAPGRYRGNFVAKAAGQPAAPIVICGSAAAVLDGGGIKHGYTLYLNGADFTQVIGVTVSHGLKGIMADNWHHGVIA